MANIKKIKLPNGTEYDIKDSGALPLTGGTVTGPVIFNDTVSMDEATAGNLVVTGNLATTNNIQANTINGVAVGSSPKFTDTVTTISTSGSGNAITAITASNGVLTATKGTTFLTSSDISDKIDTAGTGLSKSGTTLNHSNSVTAQTTQALYPIKIDAQGHISAYGSAVTSLPASDVYSWAKASSKPTYTASEVGAATSGHTHTTSIATSTGTNQVTLAANTKYVLTAGGTTYIFTTPPDTNTTYTASTTSIGSASAGTAISADDITAWTTNTPTAVTKKTVVTSASGATATVSNGVLTLTNGSFSTGDSVTVTAGTSASLSYTARSIPNISVTSKTVATGITAN